MAESCASKGRLPPSQPAAELTKKVLDPKLGRGSGLRKGKLRRGWRFGPQGDCQVARIGLHRAQICSKTVSWA